MDDFVKSGIHLLIEALKHLIFRSIDIANINEGSLNIKLQGCIVTVFYWIYLEVVDVDDTSGKAMISQIIPAHSAPYLAFIGM